MDLLTAELGQRLAARQVGLELTPEAREFVARSGYDPVYGARPLKRFLQRQLESRIARALIAGEAAEGSVVKVGVADAALAVVIETGAHRAEEVLVAG